MESPGSKPLFIALEGIDGSGKSTQASLLAERLKQAGRAVHLTAEPTDGPVGKLIRNIFRHEYPADHRVIAGLFVADRLDHLLSPAGGILARLEAGFTVVCDRYCFSSYAYQGVHMPLSWVISANSLSTELRRPDLTLFIDVPAPEAFERIEEVLQIHHEGGMGYYEKMREFYLNELHRWRGIRIDASAGRSEDQVNSDLWDAVKAIL